MAALSLVVVLKHPFMGNPNHRAKANKKPENLATPPPPPPPPPLPPVSLVEPSHKKKQKPVRVIRAFRSVVRSFPILRTPVCKFPTLHGGLTDSHHYRTSSGTRVTGTLFGYHKGRVTLSMQETPKSMPTLVMELPMQTSVLQKEMNSGIVRIALECERRPDKDKVKLLDEPMWTMYSNGKKSGYGVRREATDKDLNVMETLKAVSMGAGIIPGSSKVERPDGEISYFRAHFERVVGSRDSETLHMMSPEGIQGELSIFFVRL